MVPLAGVSLLVLLELLASVALLVPLGVVLLVLDGVAALDGVVLLVPDGVVVSVVVVVVSVLGVVAGVSGAEGTASAGAVWLLMTSVVSTTLGVEDLASISGLSTIK